MYVWPAIMRNMNVCYISSAKSGKTMAYLPAIYSFLLEENRYIGFNTMMMGPLAVIICGSTRNAEDVYDMVLKIKGTMRGRDNCDTVLAVHPISAGVMVSIVFLPYRILFAFYKLL